MVATTSTETLTNLGELVETGRILVAANKLSEAREIFLQILKEEPGEVSATRELCRIYYRHQNWSDLRDVALPVIESGSGHQEILLLYARGCNGLADWENAAVAWNRVLEGRTDWPEAYYQHARAEIRRNNPAIASRRLEELRALFPDSMEAALLAFRLALDLNELNVAAKVADWLVRCESFDSNAWGSLERLVDLRGQALLNSARCLIQQIDLSTDERALDLGEQLFRRAINRERTGNLNDAFFDYKALFIVAPDDELAERSCARIERDVRSKARQLLKGGGDEHSFYFCTQALSIMPTDIELLRESGRLSMRLRKWDDAITIWKRMIDSHDNDFEGYLQYARALDRAGSLGEAAAAWRGVLSRKPDQEEATASLAIMPRRLVFAGRDAMSRGSYLRAHELFQAVLREEPSNSEAVRRIDEVIRNIVKEMRAAYKRADFSLIIKHADVALDARPEDAEVHLLVARAAQQLRRYEVAVRAWSRLVELDPANVEAHLLRIAQCLLHLKRFSDGQVVLRRLLASNPQNSKARELSDKAMMHER